MDDDLPGNHEDAPVHWRRDAVPESNPGREVTPQRTPCPADCQAWLDEGRIRQAWAVVRISKGRVNDEDVRDREGLHLDLNRHAGRWPIPPGTCLMAGSSQLTVFPGSSPSICTPAMRHVSPSASVPDTRYVSHGRVPLEPAFPPHSLYSLYANSTGIPDWSPADTCLMAGFCPTF